MQREFFFHLVRLPKRGYRAALVAILLGAILAFGAFSFAPAAHAAISTSPEIAKSARIEIITHEALSVLVKEGTPTLKERCYNTPNHTVTITGWEGEVELIGYTHFNCSRLILCERFVEIPPSGFLIVRLC